MGYFPPTVLTSTNRGAYMPQSEVARIRENIEAECVALAHLSLFSSTASHAIVSSKFKALDTFHNELKELVGEEEATRQVVAIYDKTIQ